MNQLDLSEKLRLKIDNREYQINQIKLNIPSVELIPWLAQQSLYPKVFWKEKEERIERAALGSLLTFHEFPCLSCSDLKAEVRFYGGMRFAPKKLHDETWGGFPATCFWLPQLEISQENGTTQCLINSLSKKSFFSNSTSLDFRVDPLDFSFPPIIKRQDTPGFTLWEKNIETVLEEIRSNQIQKLVLARKSSLQFASSLSPWPLLNHLYKKTQSATVFAFQLSPHLCFLGASPEKLFQRKDHLLTAEAVAATRSRGKTSEEDLLLQQDLLNNPKELREFRFVSNFLEESLSPMAEEFSWQSPKTQILKGSHVQHLYNRLHVKLKSDVSDISLIQAMHPTPALGGFPRHKVMPLLNAIEPFDRGWYGAPIGVIDPQGANLYVGIRSGLIDGHLLHLFAGTGIVEGSLAEKEWEELEQKIRPFTEQFN